MAELDFTVRSALDALAADVTLPAMYDMLTPEQRRWARGEYARLQGGLCCHCRAPLAGPASPEVLALEIDESRYPPNFFTWAHHLHHNHATGLTIGVVHARCNAVLCCGSTTVNSEFLTLLAFFWLGVLVLVCVGSYAFGWWWRGRFEEERRIEREVRLRQEWEWNRRLDAQERREAGSPVLRVVK
jgi:hypothetical protein